MKVSVGNCAFFNASSMLMPKKLSRSPYRPARINRFVSFTRLQMLFQRQLFAEDAGEGHIGIRNVRDRVERLCGGTVAIDSQIDEGTLVAIRLPVLEKKKEGKT